MRNLPEEKGPPKRELQQNPQRQQQSEEEEGRRGLRIKKKSLTLSPSDLKKKILDLEKKEYDSLNSEVSKAGYVKGGIVRDQWETVGRFGTQSLKPSWYKKAYNGRNHREVIKSRSLWELKQYNPEYNDLLRKYREATGREWANG